MKKITKTIKALKAILGNPWLLNKVLEEEVVWQKRLKKQGFPKGLPVVEIDELFPNLSAQIDHFAFLGGGSLPTDIALLKGLSERFENCSYFEIGTWRGESVVHLKDSCSECYTLNLSAEDIIALTGNQKYAELHGYFSKGIENIIHLTGNSMHYDFGQLEKKFDLIFIDGDHHYEYVKNDTEKVFKHLVHDDSIVVWHDYAFNPEQYRPEVLAGILDGLPQSEHQNLFHVSNTMCAVYMKGHSYKTSELNYPVEPNKRFEVKMKVNRL